MRYGEGPGIPGLNCPDSKIGGTKVAAPSKTDNLTEEQKKNSDSEYDFDNHSKIIEYLLQISYPFLNDLSSTGQRT